ncbi:HIT domain-containing protein [Campylobacter sp. RM9929]|uniref:HIT family protein n=1 Tax=Campylobacter molothri TaxID=1032242 RepID=UPI001DC89E80|nr:HIT domain-containing protein [Campylobacter sp. RM10543]MBZ7946371.1 HIT domain-containing protein [Campylobacter sp. RM10536]MBZ7948164.1 HIT domain-containing protein [Campylobacter sp. RM9929]MBZ7952431.1 HIT domain-containing protein [Campylobacter sp. RM9939]MBZ7955351.1 HIT domain-containing protein [Campylobacter sp. RM17709]MBZ7956629.1 HIT domain-containing protein [Campylobacter sp. RM10541]MBZ7966571.1 HIT domain-containing protein [Campylobacter sp. RM9756]
MQYLYAPWRSEYFEKEKSQCPFCDCANKIDSDEKLGVIFRAKYCFAVMNRYPYSAGHFMIIPYLHEEHIENLDDKIWQEMSYWVREGVKILKNELYASGVNIGMNLSKDAGAGIAMHCHYHLVPRWFGDTNFITTIGETRVCGTDLKDVYYKLVNAFNNVK